MKKPNFLAGSALIQSAGLVGEAHEALPWVRWMFAAQTATQTHRLALAVSMIAILTLLVPLAHSDPPDPTWFPGVWDNADYDDVVTLATSASSIADAYVPTSFGFFVIVGRIRDSEASVLAVRPFALNSRAPPLA